jgi:hypothetical protein
MKRFGLTRIAVTLLRAKPQTSLVFLLLSLLSSGTVSLSDASACFGGDSPFCGCFVDGGAWDPSGSLLEVAYQTIGTVESCRPNGGKPFYQMQLGINDYWQAQAMSIVLTSVDRRAWCSEAVAYWHREARRPYPGGYRNWWYWSWQLTTTEILRAWYLTEESYGGRGRWIESVELNLDEFLPGYNAPCPGAYQQLMGYFYSPLISQWIWGGTSNSHSQVVDTMTVYLKPGEEPGGAIVTFDVTMIEGNSGNQVKNSNVYQDVPRYTPNGGAGGFDFLGSNHDRKIRGWGIDLASNGGVLCNWERIDWVTDPTGIPLFPGFSTGEYVDEKDLRIVAENLEFAEAMERQGGVLVAVDGADALVMEPPSERQPWTIPISDDLLRKRAVVKIEFPVPLPYRVGNLELEFAGAKVPGVVSVLAQNLPKKGHGRYRGRRTARWKRASIEMSAGANTALLHFPKGVKSRRFQVVLSDLDSATAGDVVVTGIHFHSYVHRKKEESQEND